MCYKKHQNSWSISANSSVSAGEMKKKNVEVLGNRGRERNREAQNLGLTFPGFFTLGIQLCVSVHSSSPNVVVYMLIPGLYSIWH